VMGHIIFEDHAFIKRWRAGKKMNAMGGMFKAKKKGVTMESSLCLLLEVVCIFETLEFVVAWLQKMLLKNYRK